MIDPQFAEAFVNRFHIAEQSDLDPGNALLDTFRDNAIPERCQPVGEIFGLADLDHVNFNTQLAEGVNYNAQLTMRTRNDRGVIARLSDHDQCAHCHIPMDMMRHQTPGPNS